MWWNYIEYIKEKGLAITQNSFCQSVLNFFSNKSQKTLSFNKKVTLKSRNCHKCCLFLLKIIKAIPCITEIQTKVTFFTTNTSFSLFSMPAFVFCLSKIYPMSNFLVWDVKYWSCAWILSFSGFSLIEDIDGLPTGLVLWTVWAVASGNATETVNFNKEKWAF